MIGKGMKLYEMNFESWFNTKTVKVNRKNTIEQINELALSRFKKAYSDCNKFQQQYLIKQYSRVM